MIFLYGSHLEFQDGMQSYKFNMCQWNLLTSKYNLRHQSGGLMTYVLEKKAKSYEIVPNLKSRILYLVTF